VVLRAEGRRPAGWIGVSPTVIVGIERFTTPLVVAVMRAGRGA
jgi:hypothetical protein